MTTDPDVQVCPNCGDGWAIHARYGCKATRDDGTLCPCTSPPPDFDPNAP